MSQLTLGPSQSEALIKGLKLVFSRSICMRTIGRIGAGCARDIHLCVAAHCGVSKRRLCPEGQTMAGDHCTLLHWFQMILHTLVFVAFSLGPKASCTFWEELKA